MQDGSMKHYSLRDGSEIPAIGFGTWKLADGPQAYEATLHALKAGYRLIDTAAQYGNEQSVGQAVNVSDVDREDVFVTTKLWTRDLGYDSAIIACQASLERLELEYIDLYLIHWPTRPERVEAWRALNTLKQDGLVRHIGVSNFTPEHIEELRGVAEEMPEVNQIELHPLVYEEQKDILEYCTENDILVEAYSPLAQGMALDNSKVMAIAEHHKKTPAQILVRWAIQHETVALPKASTIEKMIEDIDVFDFELSGDEMHELNTLSSGDRVTSDPHEIK